MTWLARILPGLRCNAPRAAFKSWLNISRARRYSASWGVSGVCSRMETESDKAFTTAARWSNAWALTDAADASGAIPPVPGVRTWVSASFSAVVKAYMASKTTPAAHTRYWAARKMVLPRLTRSRLFNSPRARNTISRVKALEGSGEPHRSASFKLARMFRTSRAHMAHSATWAASTAETDACSSTSDSAKSTSWRCVG